MRKTILTIIPLVIITFACDAQPANKNLDSFKKLNPSEFKKEIEQNQDIQLIDVRTPNEFAMGYIEKAVLIDYSKKQEFQQKINKLDKEKPVYVYCAVGGRSNQAANYLRNQGFKKVVDLAGGIVAWQNVGLPVTIPE